MGWHLKEVIDCHKKQAKGDDKKTKILIILHAKKINNTGSSLNQWTKGRDH